MNKVTIIHTIILEGLGPSIYCRNEGAPKAVFCFNNIQPDPNRRGRFISDISVLAQEGETMTDQEIEQADKLIDSTFVEAIRIVAEEPQE